MKVLDLFSGIGGFSLGLERAGMQTVAFCEIDPYARAVLAKHWPGVPCYDDIRTLTAERLSADGISVDVVCGGFPCQDISLAGLGAGLAGARSGLWFEMHRIIAETGPEFVIAENVSALRSRGLDVVLGSLAAIGYDAEWHCIPAAAVGAPHRRDRVWIVGYPRSAAGEWNTGSVSSAEAGERGAREQHGGVPVRPEYAGASERGRVVADSSRVQSGWAEQWPVGERARPSGQPIVSDVGRAECWVTEPDVGRVAHGVPSRVDRLARLGNAVVPQIPEVIGRAIMAAENARTAP